MESLECDTMLVADPQPPLVQSILSAREMRTSRVPQLDDLLTTDYRHYPYQKLYSSAQSEPFVALHTSGSTGKRLRLDIIISL